MRIFKLLTAIIFLSFTIQQAYAETILHISATERTEVAQDLLTARMRIEAENKDPRALQEHINAIMQRALTEANNAEGIKASTAGYNVYQYTPRPPRDLVPADWKKEHSTWRGAQELILKGRDSDALLALSGDLQDTGLVMSNLSFALSPQRAADTQDQLMEAALAKLQARALRAAKALGMGEATLTEIQVDPAPMPQPPRPLMRTMEMSEAKGMSAPVAQAGESEVSLTVSAKALLK